MSDEKLVVLLEARVSEFEKRMARAEQRGTRTYQGLRRGSRSATQQMAADMNRSTASVNQALATTSAKIGAFGKVFAGGLVGGVVATAFAGLSTNIAGTMKGIAQLGNEAKRAGISAQAFQEWKFVAEANRISVDSLVDGFKELSLRADEFITTGVGPAAEAFTRLGYRSEDLKRKLKDPSALMLEIMKRLEGLDKAAQIRVADEIFGGTGGERFVELLGQGQGAIAATIAEAHRAGAVLDDEMIAKADEIDRKFTQITTSANAFFKRVVVGAVLAGASATDFREKLDGIFSNEDEGRAVLGDDLYNYLDANRDAVAEHARDLEQLSGLYDRMKVAARDAATQMTGSIPDLRAYGFDETADQVEDLAARLNEAATAFENGEIEGEEFSARLQDIQTEADKAYSALDEVNRVWFEGALNALATLGGRIASVTSLALGLQGALAGAAGVDPATRRANAADAKMAAEQASIDAMDAQTEANEGFTASEQARNSATAESIRLEKARADVIKRAKEAGARLTDDEITSFAQSTLAGEDARSAAGRGGKGGKGAKGGGRERLDDFAKEAQSIKERTEALQIEAQVYAEVAASGQAYGDVMAYAEEKAKLLIAAQRAGKQITPALTAEIDQLALSYATAGMSAEEAAERMQQIQHATERGKNALEGMFGSIIDGSMSAKDAVIQLLAQIAQIQMMKAIMGLPGIGGLATGLGNLLSFDGGGYTGNGARSGGIDGKGGFITLMHPRETVTDHTKGQSLPSGGGQQSVHVTVGVDPDTGNLQAFVDQRAGRMAEMSEARAAKEFPGRWRQAQKYFTERTKF